MVVKMKEQAATGIIVIWNGISELEQLQIDTRLPYPVSPGYKMATLGNPRLLNRKKIC